MLKHGEVNPLNVSGLRKLEHRPPHFEQVIFDIKTTQKQIADWIYENLEGRFWLGDVYAPAFQFDRAIAAAFERHSEASYFSLMLDTVNRSEW